MTRNAALTAIMDAEERGALWSRRVLGVPVWPLERLPQCQALMLRSELGTDAKSVRRNPARNLLSRVRTSIADLSRGTPAARRTRDIWVLSASNYRRRDDAGVYQCALAEHLRKELGERLLFIERNQADLPPQHRDDVLFIDAAFILAEALGRAAGPLLASTPLGREARAPGSPASAALLCRDGVYARAMLALARGWIEKARPRAVFVLNGYHLFIPFQLAVREAKIPLIELQHGIITESHPGYVFEGAPPVDHLPDHLVVYGRHFGELLDRESPRWRGRWSVGGHPWLREKQAGLGLLPDSHFDTVALFPQTIEFTRTRIRDLATQLRKRLDPSIRIVVKPHPGDIAASRYFRGGEGIEIATPRDDTYELLRRCRLAVTVYSTVALEALAFRCRSVVLRSDTWPDDLRSLVDQGALLPAETADEVARLAELGPVPSSDADVANRLFGVREPVPSFERLIEDVRRGL